MALRSTASAFHAPSMQASAPLLAPTSELMRVASVEQMIQ
jgi:macrolide efflux pump